MQNVDTFKKETFLSAFLSLNMVAAGACVAVFWLTLPKYDTSEAGLSNTANLAKAGPEVLEQMNAMKPMQLALAGKMEDANKAAGELLVRKGHDALANACVGNVYIMTGGVDEGLKCLRKAVALSHGNRYLMLNFAQKLAAAGRNDEATTQYLALTKKAPELEQPHLELAKLYMAQKKNDLAAAELKVICDADPSNFNAERLRAIALGRAGQTPAALAAYMSAAQKETQSGPPDALKQFLGKQGAGAVDRVTYELQQQVQARPDDYVPKLRLAQLYVYGGNAKDAKDLLIEARKLAPSNAEVHRTLAVVLKQLGDDNSAMSSFAQSIKLEEQQETMRLSMPH